MNDIEKKLRRLEFKPTPSHLRRQILSAAESAACSQPLVTKHKTTWQDWLWPSPYAWTAMALIWLVIFATSPTTQNTSTVAKSNKKPSSQQHVPLFAHSMHQQELYNYLNDL